MHLDLPRILHIVLDFLGDIARQLNRGEIIDHFRTHNDAHLAARLQGIALLHALESVGDLLQLLDAADIRIEALAPSARARAGNGVGRLNDEGFDAFFLYLVVMRGDAIDDRVRAPVTLDKFGADLGMGAFDAM